VVVNAALAVVSVTQALSGDRWWLVVAALWLVIAAVYL
jgi:hypothetical protein